MSEAGKVSSSFVSEYRHIELNDRRRAPRAEKGKEETDEVVEKQTVPWRPLPTSCQSSTPPSSSVVLLRAMDNAYPTTSQYRATNETVRKLLTTSEHERGSRRTNENQLYSTIAL